MLTERYGAEIERILAKYPDKRSAAMPVMYLAQEAYGYMSQEAMDEVAAVLDLDPTHILSLAGFYTLYYEEPVGKYVLEICNDLPCALRGADEFVEMASQKLGIPVEGTTADGLFTLKTVMCLAACDKAPMLQCNLHYVENLDEAKFDQLIEELRAGRYAIGPTPFTASIAPQFIASQDKTVAVAPAPAEEDDLVVIEGIGPKIAEVLRAAGISSYDQLAVAPVEQLEAILREADLPFADPSSWAEQALLASAGDWAGLKELQDRLKGGKADDDLVAIEGIGPKIAGVLQAAGISSFAQLAGASAEQLEAILQEAELQFTNPASWAEQARLAAAGDWAGLQALQDRLKGGL